MWSHVQFEADYVRLCCLCSCDSLNQNSWFLSADDYSVCPPDSGSFDGTQLLWEIPRVVTPLVGEGAAFKSQSLSLGVEGLLLDQHTVSARGFGVVEQGGLVRIRVPFGAEGGYRKVQWIPPRLRLGKGFLSPKSFWGTNQRVNLRYRCQMCSFIICLSEFGGEQHVQGDLCDLPAVRTHLLSAV